MLTYCKTPNNSGFGSLGSLSSPATVKYLRCTQQGAAGWASACPETWNETSRWQVIVAFCFPFGRAKKGLVGEIEAYIFFLKKEASKKCYLSSVPVPGRWLQLSPVQNNSRSAPSRTSPQYRNTAITRFALCLKVKHYHFADYILKIQRPNLLDILPSFVFQKSFHHVQFTGQL